MPLPQRKHKLPLVSWSSVSNSLARFGVHAPGGRFSVLTTSTKSVCQKQEKIFLSMCIY